MTNDETTSEFWDWLMADNRNDWNQLQGLAPSSRKLIAKVALAYAAKAVADFKEAELERLKEQVDDRELDGHCTRNSRRINDLQTDIARLTRDIGEQHALFSKWISEMPTR